VRAACPGRASEAACGNQPGRPAARPWEVVMPVIKATDLAYGRLRSPDLDKQEEFLTAFGMVRADRTAKALYMRGTDSPHHLHVTELGAPKYVGIALHAGSLDDLETLARTPGASPVEHRLRNWVYDRALSGDIIVEQNIHVIDICNWVLQAHPLKACGAGGREGRPPQDGDALGNYNVIFSYPNGVDITFSSTQFGKGEWDVSERFFGTKGTSQSPYTGPLGIWGEEPWQAEGTPAKDEAQTAFSATGKFTSNLEFADREKKKAFVESIASGNFHNQADKGAESALSCMMARTAAYTGREVTWDEMLKSTETWDPKIDLNKLR